MSDPKLLILGASGMLGHKLFQILRQRFPVTQATTRQDVRQAPLSRIELLQGPDVVTGVNVMDTAALRQLIEERRPDYVINAVGIIKQRSEASAAIPSIAINSLLPHQLAAWIAPWGGRLIHFSTDCVFDGKGGRYRETDPSTAEDLYGKSKFLGEVTASNAVTLRTSIIGRELVEHRSLLDWFLSQNNKTVRGFRHVLYSGITTNQMAEVITLLVRQYPTLSGLHQVVSQPISKHDLLVLLRDAYRLNIEIVPDDREVSDRSMLGDKMQHATGYVSPDWPTLVRNLADDPTPYAQWGITPGPVA